jgi:hypothetical protein
MPQRPQQAGAAALLFLVVLFKYRVVKAYGMSFIGCIPTIPMRKAFFSSCFHQNKAQGVL